MHSSLPTQPRKKFGPLLLLLAASVTSCATTSPVPLLLVVSKQVTIPSPPAGTEPTDPQRFYRNHCKLVQYAQQTLQVKLPEGILCTNLGLLSED